MESDERSLKIAAGKSKFKRLQQKRKSSAHEGKGSLQFSDQQPLDDENDDQDVLTKVIHLLSTVSFQHTQELKDLINDKDKRILSLEDSIQQKLHSDEQIKLDESHHEIDMHQLNDKIVALESELTNQKSTIKETTKALSSSKEILQRKEQEVQLLQNESTAHKSQLKSLAGELSKLKLENNSLQQGRENDEQTEAYKSQVDSLTEEIALKNQEIYQMSNEKDEQYSQLQLEHASLVSQVNSLTDDVNNLRNQNQNLQEHQSENDNAQEQQRLLDESRHAEEVEALKLAKNKLNQEIDLLKTTLQQQEELTNDEIADLQQQLDLKTSQTNSHNQEPFQEPFKSPVAAENIQNEILINSSKLEEAQSQLAQLQLNMQDVQSQYDTINTNYNLKLNELNEFQAKKQQDLLKVKNQIITDLKQLQIEVKNKQDEKNALLKQEQAHDLEQLDNLKNEISNLQTELSRLEINKIELAQEVQEISLLFPDKVKLSATLHYFQFFINSPFFNSSIKMPLELPESQMPTIPVVPQDELNSRYSSIYNLSNFSAQHQPLPVLSKIKHLRSLLASNTTQAYQTINNSPSILESLVLERLEVEDAISNNQELRLKLDNENNQLSLSLEQLQTNNKVLTSKIVDLEDLVHSQRQELHELESYFAVKSDEKMSLEIQITRTSEEIQQLVVENEGLANDHDLHAKIKMDLSRHIQISNAEIEEMQIASTDKHDQVHAIKADLDEINKEIDQLLADKNEFEVEIENEILKFSLLLNKYTDKEITDVKQQSIEILDELTNLREDLIEKFEDLSNNIKHYEVEKNALINKQEQLDVINRQESESYNNKILEIDELKGQIENEDFKFKSLSKYKNELATKNNELQVSYMELLEDFKKTKKQHLDLNEIINYQETQEQSLMSSMSFENIPDIINNIDNRDNGTTNSFKDMISIIKEILILVMNEDDIYSKQYEQDEVVMTYLNQKQSDLQRLLGVLEDLTSKLENQSPVSAKSPESTATATLKWNHVEHHVTSLENLLNEQLLENSKFKVENSKLHEIVDNVDIEDYRALLDKKEEYIAASNKYKDLVRENREYQLKIASLMKNKNSDAYKRPYMRELYFRKDLQYQKQYLKREYQILTKKLELIAPHFPLEENGGKLNKFKSVVWLLIGVHRLRTKRFDS